MTNVVVTDGVKLKAVLVPLTDEEADVYFSSDWYKDIMTKKRHKMIADGTIKVPAYHVNNPPHIQVKKPLTVVPRPAAIIIKPVEQE